jgi:hypothetical protein
MLLLGALDRIELGRWRGLWSQEIASGLCPPRKVSFSVDEYYK